MASKYLTTKQAEAALQVVKDRFAGFIAEFDTEPCLYQPGHEGDFWWIAWEEGPDEWAVRTVDARPSPFAPVVHTECTHSWAVALYRDR